MFLLLLLKSKLKTGDPTYLVKWSDEGGKKMTMTSLIRMGDQYTPSLNRRKRVETPATVKRMIPPVERMMTASNDGRSIHPKP